VCSVARVGQPAIPIEAFETHADAEAAMAALEAKGIRSFKITAESTWRQYKRER